MAMERCLSSLYEAALSPEHWLEAVAEVARALGGGATIVQAPFGQFANGRIWMHEVDPEVYQLSPPELLSPEHNPGIRAALEAPGRMVDRREFIPDDAMTWHPVSRQFFEPNGIQHLLIGLAHADEEVGSLFVVSRRTNQCAFDGGETALAQDLAGHVGRAMRLQRSLQLSEAQVMAFGTAVEHLKQAVLLVDGELRILHANAAAEAMLAAGAGLSRWREHLRLLDQRSQRTLEDKVRRLTRGPPPNMDIQVSAMRPEGRRPLRITAQPALGDVISAIAPRGRVLLFIDDPEREVESSPEALAKSFDLTPAESRVTVLAARALPVAKIAARLGVSENTIKTQLKSAYLKTGATSRAEFVRLVCVTAA